MAKIAGELSSSCVSTSNLASYVTGDLTTRLRSAGGNLLTLADDHGLLPRLSMVLLHLAGQATSPAVDAALLNAADAASAGNARRNLQFTQMMFRILDALQQASIPALAYKGPALAEMLYGAHPVREFRDLDILIRPQDWPSAKSTLAALGLLPNQHFTPSQERAYLRSNCEMAFDGWGAHNWLEIEWNILPRYFSVDFDMDALIERAVTFPVSGTLVRTLCPEDTLLTLAIHGAKHGWCKLSWVADIADLLRTQNLPNRSPNQAIDWTQVRDRAHRLGITRIVLVALSLAAHLNPAAEDAASQMVATSHQTGPASVAVELAELFWQALYAEPRRYTDGTLLFFRMMLKLRERWSDRIRFVWRLYITPETGDWQWISLPDSLYPLYYPIRLIRLALKPFSRRVG